MVKIREGEFDDIPWILPELKEFSKFTRTKHELFPSEELAEAQLKGLMQNHLFLIAENEDGEPMGFISGLYTPHYFNPSIKMLNELLWWVRIPYRRTRAGLKLLNEFVKRGKSEVDWIVFSLESHSPVNDRCLLKRGFKAQDRSYLYEGE